MRTGVVGIGWQHAEAVDQWRLIHDGVCSSSASEDAQHRFDDILESLRRDVDLAYLAVLRRTRLSAYSAGRFARALNMFVAATQQIAEESGMPIPEPRRRRLDQRCFVVQEALLDLAERLDPEIAAQWINGEYDDIVRHHDEAFPPVFPGIRSPVAGELRAAVWAKSGGQCWYCGVMTNPFENFHADHIHPVIDGGTNDLTNLVPCCQRCNNEKHALPLEVFRQRRGSGLFWFERQRGNP